MTNKTCPKNVVKIKFKVTTLNQENKIGLTE